MVEIERLKKYWSLDILFPCILVYVCFPLVWILSHGSILEALQAVGMASVWWVMLFYDGTFSNARKWIWRFFKYHIPALLLYYLLVIFGFLDFHLYLIGVPVFVVSNLFWGVAAYIPEYNF